MVSALISGGRTEDLNRRLWRRLSVFAMFVLMWSASSLAFAQRQAAPIQLLTKIPVQKGFENFAPTVQTPNKGTLKIPESMRVREPFAWNRQDQYTAPNFDSYFPDDVEGGKQLDALFAMQLGGQHGPEDVLAAIRYGLRRSTVYKSQLIAAVGRFVWNANEQDPRAIELLYHASDVRGPVAHEAMYYGLTVLQRPTANSMRTMVEHYVSYDPEIQNRIVWGMKTYAKEELCTTILTELLRQQEKLSDNGATSALDLFTKISGHKYPLAQEIANRGMFVIGFSYRDVHDGNRLREKLAEWVGDECVTSFVTRKVGKDTVAVGLLQGVANRDKLVAKVAQDEFAQVVFSSPFSPSIFRSHQIREFAKFLPDGLPSKAKPVYGPIPDGEVFRWNAESEYQPPDFAWYFPDDIAGGKVLDELYENRESTELTAREQLEIVRQGLRRSKYSKQVLSWVSSICGWPEDPMANEIFYHAADPRTSKELRQSAIYFGLRGFHKKSPNVVRLFAEILLVEEEDRYLGSETMGSIIWSLRSDEEKKTVAGYLNTALLDYENYTPEKLGELTGYHKKLVGHVPSTYEKYADLGDFFVAFSHKQIQSAIDLSQFCRERVRDKPYFAKLAIGTEPPTKGTAFIQVHGHRGMELCVKDLSGIDGVTVVFAGPVTMLQNAKGIDFQP